MAGLKKRTEQNVSGEGDMGAAEGALPGGGSRGPGAGGKLGAGHQVGTRGPGPQRPEEESFHSLA